MNNLNEQLRNPKSRITKDKASIQPKIKTILNEKYIYDIFDIQVHHTAEVKVIDCVEYSVNEGIRNNIMQKYFGKKLLISNHSNWTTEEILKTYREQDCIEKIFRATKDNDHCAIRPQFHYTDQKIRVHIFCCLLGLTLATILHREVSDKGFHVSKFQLLDTLHSIRRCWIKDKDGSRATNVLETMDDTQVALWDIIQAL